VENEKTGEEKKKEVVNLQHETSKTQMSKAVSDGSEFEF